MKNVYLDNAATTPIDEKVIQIMQQSMQENFGNPSSTHQFGRKAKSAVETARKNIAAHFNASPSEIIFTAGGTEADNLILKNAVLNLEVEQIITSKIEHHAVLHTVDFLKKSEKITVNYVKNNTFGEIDLLHLESLLSKTTKKTLVSLMHINNEIGTILPIEKVMELCEKYDALFHTDAVQAIGHYPIDLQKKPIDFMVASAHKFHGPKGVGFAFFKKGFGIFPMIHGGNQEKGARSSTENVHSILGMEKALEIAVSNIGKNKSYIEILKKYFIKELQKTASGITFNGVSDDLEKSSYVILSAKFPTKNKMLLFSLDLQGIAVSGGSACQSGSNVGSHVLAEIQSEKEINSTSIRFSFSKYTTKEELDFTILALKKLL